MLTLEKRPRQKAKLQVKDLVTGKLLPSLQMSEDEFVNWIDEKVRAEWVEGSVILMSPVSVDHSDLTGFLSALLRHAVEADDLGKSYESEVMVRFPSLKRRRLPDLKFVSKGRLRIVQKNCIEGAPDMMVEIVSPDSVARDYRDKYTEYEKAGVKEYWIFDPLLQKVELHVLRAKKFAEVKPHDDGFLRSTVVPKFAVRPEWLWKQPLPTLKKVMDELGL